MGRVRLAAYYPGIDVFRLTAEQCLGLWANRHVVQAMRILEARRSKGDPTVEGLFDLVLLATGSREQAEREAKKYMADQLAADMTPE